MISYIKGALGAVEDDVIVVETGGIGLAVHVPLSLLEELPALGEEVTVYTYFQVREDAMTLYGFLHRQDREMFKQLIGVNGIGPKGALGILSVMRPDDLRIAIVSGDAKAISKAPGIGAKTAQRLILDLKDKVDLEEVMMSSFGGGKENSSDAGASAAGMAASAKEAVAALTALGYTGMEASKAVKKVEITENMSVEDILKASLKHLSFL
jgi:holliday junction DNA helicase RuvA